MDEKQLAQHFEEAGFRLYLVGGSLRDEILGREVHDLDYTTAAIPTQIADVLTKAGLPVYRVGEKFGTIATSLDGMEAEITTFRSETTGRHPEVTFVTSLEEDLARRDFTINSMAKDVLTGEVFDPYHGRRDLDKKMLRSTGIATERFQEDPLRIMRAARLAAQLYLSVDGSVIQAMKFEGARLATISKERIRDELLKLLVSEHADYGLCLLRDTNLLVHIVPELDALVTCYDSNKTQGDVYSHTIDVVMNVPREPTIRLAALLHDIGKPATRAVKDDGETTTFYGHDDVGAILTHNIVKDRLALGLVQGRDVEKLVKLHMRRIRSQDFSRPAIRRLTKEAGNVLDNLTMLWKADILAGDPDPVQDRLERLDVLVAKLKAEQHDFIEHPPVSPLDGKDIMALLGINPGPTVGKIKHHLDSLVLLGVLAPDDAEKATAVATEMFASL